MKIHFLDAEFLYDGSQLKSLYAYLTHGVLGPSILSWRGPCNIPEDHMIDGEDLLQQQKICGDSMLHFIIETFDHNLFSGVLLQRLFASLALELLQEKTKKHLTRSGDDIYWDTKKLSISIASQSSRSVMIHFAMNIVNKGTPVPTCALSDFQLDPKELSLELMQKFKLEYDSCTEATWKVRELN